MKIEYNGKKVNKAWKEQVKSSSSLAPSQKKQLINGAYKQVAVDDTKEAIWFVIKFIASIALMGLVYWLVFYAFRWILVGSRNRTICKYVKVVLH